MLSVISIIPQQQHPLNGNIKQRTSLFVKRTSPKEVRDRQVRKRYHK